MVNKIQRNRPRKLINPPKNKKYLTLNKKHRIVNKTSVLEIHEDDHDNKTEKRVEPKSPRQNNELDDQR